MNKYNLFLLLTALCGVVTAQSRTDRIEIPITLHDGLGKGMGEHSMHGLSFADWDTYIWKEIIPKPQGLPDGWTDIRMGVEFLNQPQFIYQHTQAGRIPEGYMQASWLENAQFTETPIRCYLLFAEGVNAEGKKQFVVDQNNNGDFSDDTYFYTDSITFEHGRKEMRIQFDAYINGTVVPQERTLYIGSNPQHQMYFIKVAEYATCQAEGQTFMLSPYGYNHIGYEDFEVIPLAENSQEIQGHASEPPARRGEYVQMGNALYRFQAVNINQQVLVLEKDTRPQAEITSMQTGFKPYPLSGNEFTSKDSISLEKYKGKRLLLMVWSPGCGSCIEKIPAMNEIYAAHSPNIELLGVSLHTNEEHLTSVKEEHTIAFPLMIGEYGRLHEGYMRLNTPTFFLINPEGVIEMKTLNLDDIKQVLSE